MCLTPITITDKRTGELLSVPCSRCPKCLKRRANGWAFRLDNEMRRSSSVLFLTLTYDTKHVFITGKGAMGLCKRHVQLFFKRLRKAHSKKSKSRSSKAIRYFVVGEYGSTTKRPHYHAIVFNAQYELVQSAWQYGNVHFGMKVNGGAIAYCLKYMMKKGLVRKNDKFGRIPEFSMMSKHLGDNYVSPAMVRWHHADLFNRMYCNLKDGKKIAMPRYYKDRIYQRSQRSEIAGYQKGELERMLLMEIINQSGMTAREKNAAKQAAFDRMYMKAELNRYL